MHRSFGPSISAALCLASCLLVSPAHAVLEDGVPILVDIHAQGDTGIYRLARLFSRSQGGPGGLAVENGGVRLSALAAAVGNAWSQFEQMSPHDARIFQSHAGRALKHAQRAMVLPTWDPDVVIVEAYTERAATSPGLHSVLILRPTNPTVDILTPAVVSRREIVPAVTANQGRLTSTFRRLPFANYWRHHVPERISAEALRNRQRPGQTRPDSQWRCGSSRD